MHKKYHEDIEVSKYVYSKSFKHKAPNFSNSEYYIRRERE